MAFTTDRNGPTEQVKPLSSSALAEKLSVLDAEGYLNDRAARGREVVINLMLAKVPNTAPSPEDKISPDEQHP